MTRLAVSAIAATTHAGTKASASWWPVASAAPATVSMASTRAVCWRRVAMRCSTHARTGPAAMTASLVALGVVGTLRAGLAGGAGARERP
jgi:hypothetical protein